MQTNQGTRVTVWATRMYSKKTGADFEQLLATYDLESGELLSSVQIDERFRSDDFRLDWDHGNRAWG